MIPRKIHYCWFGGNPLPELAQKCIASWKKFCPDYEIIEWNESTFDINCCNYVKEAYEAKKWAFVSDYARLKILYDHGGIYFDTDVELIRPIEHIVEKGSFMGREEGIDVASGLGMGTCKYDDFCKELLDGYENRHFTNPDGSFDLTTVVEFTTKYLVKYGLEETDEVQKIRDIYIYPKEYFCPMDYHTGDVCLTEHTCSIHHYSASWYDDTQKYALRLKRSLGQVMPRKMAAVLATAVAKAKCDGVGVCVKWILKKRR